MYFIRLKGGGSKEKVYIENDQKQLNNGRWLRNIKFSLPVLYILILLIICGH